MALLLLALLPLALLRLSVSEKDTVRLAAGRIPASHPSAKSLYVKTPSTA
eukprot:SAG31_NODE_135_length_23206_cov_25.707967_17_plen_50_part_00